VEPPLDPKVRQAAQEIESWLAENPGAAETLRGIVEWWLMRQRFEEAWTTVEEALEYLIDQGVVKRTSLPDGGELYSKASSADES
jgi:hypothetical protein